MDSTPEYRPNLQLRLKIFSKHNFTPASALPFFSKHNFTPATVLTFFRKYNFTPEIVLKIFSKHKNIPSPALLEKFQSYRRFVSTLKEKGEKKKRPPSLSTEVLERQRIRESNPGFSRERAASQATRRMRRFLCLNCSPLKTLQRQILF